MNYDTPINSIDMNIAKGLRLALSAYTRAYDASVILWGEDHVRTKAIKVQLDAASKLFNDYTNFIFPE